jgi:uncharacterized protein YndB with AHSA1/START domain
MRPITVHTSISAPREQVFDFVADLAGRPAYTDHYLKDYRLANPDPYGLGAAARFRLEAPLAKEYAELAVVEFARPRRIVEEVRYGRRGRNRSVAVYDFVREGASLTRVELTTLSEPATPIDRVKELGAHAWMRRNTKTSLERLRMIFEEPPEKPLKRVTVAGYEPEKAARFGTRTGADPGRPATGGTPPAALSGQ